MLLESGFRTRHVRRRCQTREDMQPVVEDEAMPMSAGTTEAEGGGSEGEECARAVEEENEKTGVKEKRMQSEERQT